MAIKYYCDGCDIQVPYDDCQRLSVIVSPTNGTNNIGSGEYELCKSCAPQLVIQSNPKKWPRRDAEKAA